MKFSLDMLDKFGLKREHMRRVDGRTYFGVDWLSDDEFTILDEAIADGVVDIYYGKEGLWSHRSQAVGLSQAVTMESEIVDADKVLWVRDGMILFVSDDRDIFYVFDKRDNTLDLAHKMQQVNAETVTQRFLRTGQEPPKLVGHFFRHFYEFNIEVSMASA